MPSPWQIATGLAIALGALLGAGLMRRFDYLAPYSSYIASEHWLGILVHFGAAVAAIGLAASALARSLGLVDIGRKVDVIERSIRRGDSSPELGRLLREEADGTFTE